MSIRKQYSFPSELSLQRQEPMTTARPLVRNPIRPMEEKPMSKEDTTYTTKPLQIDEKPKEGSEVIPRPSGGGGVFIPPSGGGGSEAEESGTDTIKKADWLPILLIGAGALIFVIKPFK